MATLGVLALLACVGENPAEFLARHQSGDRRAVLPEDTHENELSALRGLRVPSYVSIERDDSKVWDIVEADRSSTRPGGRALS